jgi:SET domain-containing protein
MGVFAIRKIRKNEALFFGDNDEMIWVKESELPRVPRSTRHLHEDFAVFKIDRANGERGYGCPANFNRLTVSWYLNHSAKPNLRCDENYNYFAFRDIHAGEELTVGYSAYRPLETMQTSLSSLVLNPLRVCEFACGSAARLSR